MTVSRIARIGGRGILSSVNRVASRSDGCALLLRPMSTTPATVCDSVPSRRNFGTHQHASASHGTRGMLVLETAAKEAHQLQLRSASMQNQRGPDQVQRAMNAAETLLQITNDTSSLSNSIKQSPAQANEIHKAFLKITQWCISQTTSQQSTFGDLLEHPLLDSLLQLSVRAHQLGLAFHLPLYKSLAQTIASQPSIHSPSHWVLQIAQWARCELGELPQDFFNEPLLALTERQQSKDVVHILQSMHRHLNISEINETATKSILLNLKSSIRSMWKKQPLNFTLLEEDCREIVCLLEASIMKIASSQTISDIPQSNNSNLRSAIEDIFDDELGDDSLMDDEMFLGELLQETTELMESLEDMPEADDDIPLEDSSLLYTRSMDLRGRGDSIPDITYQIMGKGKGPLKYSKDMERHIYYQFCPKEE